MAVTVQDVDKGWKSYLEPWVNARPAVYAVDVGTSMDALKATPADKPMGDYFYPAAVEYGTSRMAARPFMLWTLEAHDNYADELKRIGEHLTRAPKLGPADIGLTLIANLRILAEQVVAHIQQTIVGVGAIDTGRMHNSMRLLRVIEAGASTVFRAVGALARGGSEDSMQAGAA